MDVRKCEAEMCSATEFPLRSLAGYYHCLATAGETVFVQCQGCLARTLLAELGNPAGTLAELREKIPLLENHARVSMKAATE